MFTLCIELCQFCLRYVLPFSFETAIYDIVVFFFSALFHAVPILCTPIFGDQLYNSRRTKAKGFGDYADLKSDSADELASKIKNIVNDLTFQQTVSRGILLSKSVLMIIS